MSKHSFVFSFESYTRTIIACQKEFTRFLSFYGNFAAIIVILVAEVMGVVPNINLLKEAVA